MDTDKHGSTEANKANEGEHKDRIRVGKIGFAAFRTPRVALFVVEVYRIAQ
jgi:hypothetical protein